MALQYPLQNDDPKPLQPTGEFAHANFPESAHAVDFECPPETPVVAADDGEIIFVKDNAPSNKPVSIEEYIEAQKAGTEKQLVADRTNLLCIKHDDGTYTEYLHLAQGSSPVKVGDRVTRGQIIATTGLSGVMDIPHLHFNRFQVEEDDSGRRSVSIPFEMVHATRGQVEEVLENLPQREPIVTTVDMSACWDKESMRYTIIEQLKQLGIYKPNLLFRGVDGKKINVIKQHGTDTPRKEGTFCSTEAELTDEDTMVPSALDYATDHGAILAVYDGDKMQKNEHGDEVGSEYRARDEHNLKEALLAVLILK